MIFLALAIIACTFVAGFCNNESLRLKLLKEGGDLVSRRSFVNTWCIPSSPLIGLNFNILLNLVAVAALYYYQTSKPHELFVAMLVLCLTSTAIEGQAIAQLT